MRCRRVSLSIGAAVLAAALALPAAGQVGGYKDIKYPALPEFKISKPTVTTLKNGMTVFLVEDHELPLIAVNARIRTGSNWEPADKTGLASIMGQVQRTGGTARMKGDEIDDYLAIRAASIETGMSDDSGRASMNCLKGDFDDVFRVFADVLRTPAFAEDKIELAKVQANTGIARRNDNVMGILFREFPRLIYGKDSPLSRIEEYATVAAVNRDDLVAWHKKYYVPNNVYLGVVGDFDTAELKKKIDAVFGDWPKGPAEPLSSIPYRKEPAPGIYFVEKTDVTQAYVAMGHLGIDMKNPDYFAVQVMNEVLGGGFASRMFSNVRSKKGLAYNVFGDLGADFLYPGVLRAGLQTKTSTAVQGIEAVKDEVVGIIDRPPDDAELKRAKDSILNSFVFNYDSKTKILNQQMLYAFYGLPADFLEQYRANIDKVTRDDVARVAKKYVHPDQLTLLVVGKSDEFDKPLSTLGTVTNLDIAIPPPAGPAKAKATAETAGEGRATFGKMASAIVGAKGSSITSFRRAATVKATTPMGEISIKQREWLVYPDKVRQEQELPFGVMTVVWDGKDGLVISAQGSQPLPDSMKGEIAKSMSHDLLFLASKNGDPALKVVSAGTEDVGGTSCRVLEVEYRESTTRLYLDAKTQLPVKQSFQGQGMAGAPASIEVLYSNWKPVDGVMIPFAETVKADGKDVQSITVDEFEINPKVQDSLFQKPAA